MYEGLYSWIVVVLDIFPMVERPDVRFYRDVLFFFLKKELDKEVPCLLDPIFLLSPKEWKEIMVDCKKRNYIFVYNLNGGTNLMKIAEKVKQKTKLKIICATPSYLPIRGRSIIVRRDLGPREFIGMIANATYVVTDSFHGTAFSVLFSKPIISYIAMPSTSSRIYSLLQTCSMETNFVKNPDEFEFEKISYSTDSYKALKPFIEKSSSYINQAIL